MCLGSFMGGCGKHMGVVRSCAHVRRTCVIGRSARVASQASLPPAASTRKAQTHARLHTPTQSQTHNCSRNTVMHTRTHMHACTKGGLPALLQPTAPPRASPSAHAPALRVSAQVCVCVLERMSAAHRRRHSRLDDQWRHRLLHRKRGCVGGGGKGAGRGGSGTGAEGRGGERRGAEGSNYCSD